MSNSFLAKVHLLGLVLLGVGAGAEASDNPQPRVIVAVHDHAGVSPATLAEAEHTASLIFKDAGLEVELVGCGSTEGLTQNESACRTTRFPTLLQLTIVQRSQNLKDSVLGIAYLGEDGSGCYGDIFLHPAEELHEQFYQMPLGTLLGHVLAHEVAHLLLGTNSHSDHGIMRAHWTKQDLDSAAKYALLFTRAQAATMRAKVAVSLCPSEEPSVEARRAPN